MPHRVALAALALLLTASFAAAQTTGGAQDVATVEVAKSPKYGEYLTDAQGRALYLFMADKGQKQSACYDACAKAWPPLTTKQPPKAGDPAVQQKLLGTITRKDGTMQVTYDGWPLYYFVKDKGEGQTTGQDVKGFGAEWYLVTPSGHPVGHK